ncbi:MAG: DNA polymerase I [Alphaproteobacteria bacterium RIFCSPLOWO2_01_FULL_40_26]|nr:MAG: DNA polymerase I [Alphaproteobacteria bacterium RIFCSPHIGHO2_02_FULL_40_34]OFW94881.1 MAG: DNA polymerase I [Alphaproteobacteria bacterium RIFCSPLOWO2_01_FULL_40_26]OFX10507.1 MAG: DNA polymerase I [Alphaproteobacteria bacterium RIFCSPLOWO2_02_FULL_40_19]OFX10882.1 MAG: DNA polymerase I [Alphaproteobacteria bacterium RIFCSPLOWO2_12_FULL_40_11]
MSKKIALIDGYGFVFRAYHALPPLTRADGTQVGAVYGFTNMLIKLLAGLDVSHIAVVFDSGSKTFRNEIFPEYKANRPPCPEDLKPQFPLVRKTAESLNIPVLEKIGFEADDIIATIAKKSAANNYEVLIVSSDKDLMQLVDEHVFMYDAMRNKFIGKSEVKEKFFVEPNQLLDVLALIGDSSDNVPGVRGIGPKTAAELISQFGTLENLFDHLSEIKQEKRRQMLTDGIEKAQLSKTLITLKEDVELGISLKDLEIKAIDPHKLLIFLEEQGFRSLVTRVKKEFAIADNNIATAKNSFDDVKKIKITNQKTIDELYQQAAKNGIAIIDLQNDFLTISTCKTNESPQEIFYFETKTTDLFTTNEFTPNPQHLQNLLLNNSIKKISFNSKSFLRSTKHTETSSAQATRSTILEDVSLINHLLNSSVKNDLRELININLDENLEERGFGEIFAKAEKAKNFSEKKIDFFCFRNFAIYKLYKILRPQIFELKLNNAYISFELPLLAVLARMEKNGIKIDDKKLKELSQEFGGRIEELKKEIYVLAGCEFNIASTKQLSEVLFEKLGLTSSKKSKKTGALSTGAKVLEELSEEGYPIAQKILEFRKFSKLKNTYTDALPKEINPETGRIHSNFSTISTITGRLSSSNPNLQNIPIKTAEGKKIHQCFIAEKNHLLIAADYSQIELRVIAHMAKIEALIQAFEEDKDIHKITAAQIFKIPENEVDENIRNKAKAINFGIIYGISAFGLARQLNIARNEAADYIKSYLATYPGIDDYMKNYIEMARQNGYVSTISGRKCFIHGINDKNPIIRQESERLAINAPIQGSAADIIKKAMIALDNKLHKNNLRSKIILQIHDELIVEAPREEAETAAKILTSEMENVMNLDVPLKVDIKIGENWS